MDGAIGTKEIHVPARGPVWYVSPGEIITNWYSRVDLRFSRLEHYEVRV